MISGIYRILNSKNGKMYIGSSKNLRERKINHFSMLRNNSHHSLHLQRAWNKSLNKSDFVFEILEYCEESLLIEKENYYLDSLCMSKDYIENSNKAFRKICYNTLPFAQKGFSGKHSPETREKLKYCNPYRKQILVYNSEGEYVETMFSSPEVSKKYNLSKSALLNLCKKKVYIGKKSPYLFGFIDDEDFIDFIEKSSKPIVYIDKKIGKKYDREKRKLSSKFKKTLVEFDSEKIVFKSQIEAAEYLNIHPSNFNRILKSGKKYKKKYFLSYYNDIV